MLLAISASPKRVVRALSSWMPTILSGSTTSLICSLRSRFRRSRVNCPSRILPFPFGKITVWLGTVLPLLPAMKLPSLLFAQNQWPSSCGARRETFLKHPYTLTKNGFGHEDYALNIEAASAGIKHIIASGATLFLSSKGRLTHAQQ